MTEPLRVALVGCGNIALGHHIPAYLAVPERFRIVGIADPTPERLELGRAAAGLAADQVHADVAELLARADVDAVDVCTPQHLHRDVAVAAARAGKHVLCEKPIAAVPADAEAMRAAAAEAGTVLAVVANYLFFPEMVVLRRIIESGELGEIRTVRVDMLGVHDLPGAAGYKPAWRHDPAQSGGGVLVDMLHGVYLAESLLGERARQVSAFVDSGTDGDAVEGLALCRLEAERRVALVNIGWGVGPGGVIVHGESGRAVAQYRDNGTMPWAPFESLTVTTEHGTRTVDLPAGPELEPLVLASMRDTVVDFADAVRDGRAPAADAAAALHILEVTVAAYASGALGRTVPLPFPEDGALFRRGAVGLTELDVPEAALVRRRGLFGLGPSPAIAGGA
ncbi:Gfo/Idh/MocA family protein [Tsukamurella sp. 1534]|uniref:Gfo/Idh/MocA family protein n=1 Tax=Tsukamurella sp. 1534 TaxID=1151061 RepID=UPI00030B6504|nr:Gfo/Idh/MocA family oxidoreductase [Tsukamurella sp. 1534]